MENDNQTVQAIRNRIEQSAQRVGRTAADITLVAVSKQKPIKDIVTAYNAGIRNFGENRVEELEEKAQYLSQVWWATLRLLPTISLHRAPLRVGKMRVSFVPILNLLDGISPTLPLLLKVFHRQYP